MSTMIRRTLVGVALLLVTAAPALAQMSTNWFVSPTLAMNTGGVTTTSSPAVGVSGGWMGASRLGVEAELAWTPGFFEQDGFRVDRRVRTFMGNAILRLTPATTAFQPFVTAGFGVVSPHLADAGRLLEVESEEPGFSAGAGVQWMKNKIGVRGDVRYFKTLGDDETGPFGVNFSEFDFWRVSTGLVVKF